VASAPACRYAWGIGLTLAVIVFAAGRARANVPATAPIYQIDLELQGTSVQVREIVTWTNCTEVPESRLVFNCFPLHRLSFTEQLVQAKMLEIVRLSPREGMLGDRAVLEWKSISLTDHPSQLPASAQPNCDTALTITLPQPVEPGQSVTVTLMFTLQLPRRQGPWGIWKGVASVVDAVPALAVHDQQGWHPVPFVPWHPAIYQEAGYYSVQAVLPKDMQVASLNDIADRKPFGNDRQVISFRPRLARDFGFIAGPYYHEQVVLAGRTRLRCLTFAEHQARGTRLLAFARDCFAAYESWFGPYSYDEITIVEGYPGGLEAAAAGIVMLDERIFSMPDAAEDWVRLLLARQLGRAWWRDRVGVNGYGEAWLDEGFVSFAAQRILDRCSGRQSLLVQWPAALAWLPPVERETLRSGNLQLTLARGELGPAVQELPAYDHAINFTSLVCERGAKVFGLIERRLGEAGFQAFLARLQREFNGRILSVADFQRALEQETQSSWESFFGSWVRGKDMTDWGVEGVHVTPADNARGEPGYQVQVNLSQRRELSEPTQVEFQFDAAGSQVLRVDFDPQIAEVRGRIGQGGPERFTLNAWLPERPVQVIVDPDRELPDADPGNNRWKAPPRFRLTPIYTPLEESDLACASDRWNLACGPWISQAAFNDPWFTATDIGGFRLGAFRNESFAGGIYTGYRPQYRDLVLGADGLWDHWPWPTYQAGFSIEKSLTAWQEGESGSNRASFFLRHVLEESASFYQTPTHYLEWFNSITDNPLPAAKWTPLRAERFDRITATGVHYSLNLEAPYWDAVQGFRIDATYASGIPVLGQNVVTQQASAQIAAVTPAPEGLGWLSENRLAYRLYGATGLPTKGELFAMGGPQLFRGLDLTRRQGSSVWVASVEWRGPIASDLHWDMCDHMVGIHDISFAVFEDAGNAYLDKHPHGPTLLAPGAGLRVNLNWFSFVERSTLRLDAAKCINSRAPGQLWLAFEQPF
jgi:hypothetical protein